MPADISTVGTEFDFRYRFLDGIFIHKILQFLRKDKTASFVHYFFGTLQFLGKQFSQSVDSKQSKKLYNYGKWRTRPFDFHRRASQMYPIVFVNDAWSSHRISFSLAIQTPISFPPSADCESASKHKILKACRYCVFGNKYQINKFQFTQVSLYR